MIRKHLIAPLFVLSIVFISSFFITTPALAGTEHNVYGWAWSSTIGWIRFNNCTNPQVSNTCSGTNYGVSVTTDTTGSGKIEGYAWSSNIGWIRFGGLDPSAGGGDRFPVTTNNAQSDVLLLSNNQVTGWARVCSVYESGCSGALKSKPVGGTELGGWDGWISLKGNPGYGIIKSPLSISGATTISVLRGFAWGSTNLGWIKFDPLTSAQATLVNNGCPGVCIISPTDYTLTVSPYGTGNGAVAEVSNTQGAINCRWSGSSRSGICSRSYTSGSTVSLTASPGTNSTFGGWGGLDLTRNGNNVIVRMNTDKSISAIFNVRQIESQYTYAVKKVGTAVGSISANVGGIKNCTSDTGCTSTSLDSGTSVTLTATKSAGVSVSWSGVTCAEKMQNGPNCTFTLPANNNTTVIASFTQDYTLTVSPYGTGNGAVAEVSNTQGAINCRWSGSSRSGICSRSYTSGSTVSLTASPGTNSTFGEWWGLDLTRNGNDVIVRMNTNKLISARFNARSQYTYAVKKVGTAVGSISANVGGIKNCTSDTGCTSTSLDSGTSVTLTATKSAGVSVSWSGVTCAEKMQNGPNCTFTLPANNNTTVIASFTEENIASSCTIICVAGSSKRPCKPSNYPYGTSTIDYSEGYTESNPSLRLTVIGTKDVQFSVDSPPFNWISGTHKTVTATNKFGPSTSNLTETSNPTITLGIPIYYIASLAGKEDLIPKSGTFTTVTFTALIDGKKCAEFSHRIDVKKSGTY